MHIELTAYPSLRLPVPFNPTLGMLEDVRALIPGAPVANSGRIAVAPVKSAAKPKRKKTVRWLSPSHSRSS